MSASAIIPDKTADESYVGTCPVCENQQKLEHAAHVLVFHGYKRPGDGSTYGTCFGVGYPAWELSAEGAERYLEHLRDCLTRTTANLAHHTDVGADFYHEEQFARDAPRDYRGRRIPKMVPIPREESPYGTYARLREDVIRQLKWDVEGLTSSVKHFTAKIAAWQPGALTTAAKAERDAADLAKAKREERAAAAEAKRVIAAAKRKITDLRWKLDHACGDVEFWTNGHRKDEPQATEKIAQAFLDRDASAAELAPLVGKSPEALIKFYAKKNAWRR